MPFLSIRIIQNAAHFVIWKKIVNNSDVLFAVNVILNFSKIQNFENPTLDTKIKKRKSFFNRFREHITGECTSLFH